MTTQKLIANLVAYLESTKPDESIAVVDATRRAPIELPTLAVKVATAEPHSVALVNVLRCQVEITLRTHAGDEDGTDPEAWQDQIETILNDPSLIKANCTDEIRIDFWNYGGSETDWDESMMECTFAAECLVTRTA
jgi:hypothetical protein